MKNFKGRLFAGKLFVGKLFRTPVEIPRIRAYPVSQPRRKKRKDKDDDVLIFIV